MYANIKEPYVIVFLLNDEVCISMNNPQPKKKMLIAETCVSVLQDWFFQCIVFFLRIGGRASFHSYHQ